MKCKCENCEKCPYPDCICDDFDYSLSEELDRQILKDREIVEDIEPKRTGKRGRPRLTPEQRLERDRRKKEKQKKYYEEHKAERIQYQKEYNNTHYTEVREYKNKRYKTLKELYGKEYFNAKNREQYRRQRQSKSVV